MSAPRFDEAWLRAHVWPRFSRVLQREEIYLANHSLGRPPDRMAEDVRAALDAWYRDMDGAWSLWMEGREAFRRLTAKLLNVSAGAVVPKTSAGQGLRAVLNALPGKPRVLTSDAEFDSLDFILRVYRDKGRIELKTLPFEGFKFEGCDLVVISTVAFRTGRVLENLEGVIREAHAQGARVLLDVYHHAGVLPLDLAALDADFAVGGSYKYLRGGPGACWLYVHPRHHGLRTLDTGWFAKKEMFAYARPEPPQFAPGGDAWLESTPPVLAPFQALAGLELTLELGVERIRDYNRAQKALLASLLPVTDEGGAFVVLRHPGAAALAATLQQQGVKADARGKYLRLCPDYLNSRADLERAARIVKLAQSRISAA
ncbi:MAG TPA: aminotransferase class V-fold PLP-dependent enzyme [Burkholderiales bacterium]|nr:aminotransferase class V-fold PLP-dependent enzyme [Burkholderiales bacterium]